PCRRSLDRADRPTSIRCTGMSDQARDDVTTLRAEEVDGFFPADSMVRRLHRERVAAFSGLRALLMQACEPLGVVGFEQHSIIFDDPRTRLLRTDERMSRIYFGTEEQPERTGRIGRAM